MLRTMLFGISLISGSPLFRLMLRLTRGIGRKAPTSGPPTPFRSPSLEHTACRQSSVRRAARFSTKAVGDTIWRVC